MVTSQPNERDELPIWEVIDELKKNLTGNNTVILQAPPGAGKSTILPLQLVDEKWLNGKKILMLEPRRLAARAVANRMANTLNDQIPGIIGYRVRFENKISKNTKIEVVTEGILTRMLQSDNSLEEYGLVIFDEFHERSLHADLALALVREAQQILRPDLRILIMSATLDGDKISSLLGNAPIITSKGRQHPITIKHIDFNKDIQISIQAANAIKLAMKENAGDILVFLPGAAEIYRTSQILEEQNLNARVHLLFGDLPQNKQQAAIIPDPEGKRKVILSTSIAETSLTIEGVKVVIDSGFSRIPKFDIKSGLTRLETVRVTLDTADQRAGRAGRLGPGVCYRLWSEATHHHLLPNRTPEILEADLSAVVLELAKWGISDPFKLNWITPPNQSSVSQAKELLTELHSLKDGKITEKGIKMLELPTHPRIAHMLLESLSNNLIQLATDLAAILEEKDPLEKHEGVNVTLRVERLRKWRNKEYVSADRNVLERIERLASSWRKAFNVTIDNSFPIDEQVGKLIASAYPERIAKQLDKHRYRLKNGKVARLSENDPLANNVWLSIAHMDAGIKEGKIFLAAPIDQEDITEFAVEYEVIEWDYQKGILISRTELKVGDIIIKTLPLKNIDAQKRNDVLFELIRKEGENLFNWDDAEELLNRIQSIKNWRPELELPDFSKKYLLSNPDKWLTGYLDNIRTSQDFNKVNVLQLLQTSLSWEQQQLIDRLAPTVVKVPSGSQIPLKYNSEGSAPVLAVRLQEVFGLIETPTVNEGRVKILLHLLSPGYKPVQVTQDLKSFWKNTYPEVRKELRIRYSKHHWPEDPWTAEAVRGVKRKLN